jgi:hypothetical protein
MFIFIIKSEKEVVCVNIVYLICLILLLIFLQKTIKFCTFSSRILRLLSQILVAATPTIFLAMPPGTNLVVMLILANLY